MTNPNDSDNQNVRRVGRESRKERLESGGGLFPEEPTRSTQELPRTRPAARPDTAERFPPLPSATVPQPTASAPPAQPRRAWANVLAALFVVLTCGALLYVVYVFQNPYSALNPLPPFTQFIEVSATPGPTQPPVTDPAGTAPPQGVFVVTEDAPTHEPTTEPTTPEAVSTAAPR